MRAVGSTPRTAPPSPRRLSRRPASTGAAPQNSPLPGRSGSRNAIKAYDRYEQWNPASEADLLTAHEILMAGLVDAPGHYRSGAVAVMGQGRVHHVGPSAVQVPRLMADLLSWLGDTAEHPLVAGSVFHYEFEIIHPFRGRQRTPGPAVADADPDPLEVSVRARARREPCTCPPERLLRGHPQ